MESNDYFESVRQILITKRKKEIETLRALDLAEVPDLPNCSTPAPNDFHPSQIFLSFPANFAVRDQVIAILIAAGWQKGSHFESSSAFYDDFSHPDKSFGLSLAFKTYIAGATCICRQIGTEETPIFEWVCPEAVNA